MTKSLKFWDISIFKIFYSQLVRDLWEEALNFVVKFIYSEICKKKRHTKLLWTYTHTHTHTHTYIYMHIYIYTLNEIHPTIKFTAEWSQKSINFLDVTVSLIDGQIETDLYVKPTDSHQYLHSSLCHPYHCKKSILYSQALRLNRICSNNSFLTFIVII